MQKMSVPDTLEYMGTCHSSFCKSLVIKDEGGNLTNAAIVLFGKDPSRFFSQCKVRLARFEGKVMDEFRDQTVCYGNLFEQYDSNYF